MKRIVRPKFELFKKGCVRCGCVFEYDLRDVSAESTVKCPCCGFIGFSDAEDNGIVRCKTDE